MPPSTATYSGIQATSPLSVTSTGMAPTPSGSIANPAAWCITETATPRALPKTPSFTVIPATDWWHRTGMATGDSPAVFRPGNHTVYFRFFNSSGTADARYIWGAPGWLPVAGDFGQD